MIERHLNIVVASLTRNRPRMLVALIESWAAMQAVKDTNVRCLVIENDTDEKSLEIVEGLRERFPELHLDYVLEPRPGIPVARNRALDEARKIGADLLCFVDDDEEVAPDWLEHLVAEYRTSGATAVGGPVVPRKPDEPLDRRSSRIFAGLEARSTTRYRKIAERMRRNDARHVTISTNNCLYDLSVVGHGELRFDESMVWTGGSDAKLSADIAAAGEKLAWSDRAIVWETQPKERLTAAYIIRTTRDREAMYLVRKIRQNKSILIGFGAISVARLVAFIALVPTSLLSNKALCNMLLNTGWILAFLYAICAKTPKLYQKVTGY